MKKSVLTLCVALAACASASTTYTADGRAAYSLNCSGSARNWGACYEKAGDLCGSSGYDVLQQVGEGGFVAGGSFSGAFAGSTHARSMLIACKTK